LKHVIVQKTAAVALFGTLASGVRLDIYRLLARKGAEGLVAGDIAAALHVPPANLSFHLKAMTQVGLLTVEPEGRFQRYRANLPLMQDLIAYLTEKCCGGNPERCAVPRRLKRTMSPTSSTATVKTA
jgi:DNA-binding transcriptional ArsR family regulator